MTTYVTNDGAEFSAESAADVVKKLKALSFADSEISDDAFMQEVRARVAVQSGATIHLGPMTEFVSDLIRSGFLKEKKEDD